MKLSPERLRQIVFTLIFFLAILFGWNGWQRYQRVAVMVEWSTASELDTVGFNLYRGDTLDGPVEKINPALVPPAPDPLVGGDYSFQDDHVTAGRQYFYWLEDVSVDGATSRHGPIEFVAQRDIGALIQLLSAGALLILAGFGIRREFSPVRETLQPEQEPPQSNE